MPEPSSTNVGFVGLGHMGEPMATLLVEAGFTVSGYDSSADTRARLAGRNLNVAASLAETVSAAEVIILMLPNSDVVESVIGGAEFQAAMRPHTTVIDMSSSEPLRTRKLAEDLARAQISLVDAPVSGGVKGATAGTLTIMVGGSESEFEALKPIFTVLGTPVHAGPIGAGHAVKALNNLLSATHLWATCEAIDAGREFGLSAEVMLSIFNTSSGRSGSTENKWPNFILPGKFNSGFAMGLMLKDMRIATTLASTLGKDIRLGLAAVSLWSEAVEGLGPVVDHTEVALWVDRDHASLQSARNA